jgi:hypothetical protein
LDLAPHEDPLGVDVAPVEREHLARSETCAACREQIAPRLAACEMVNAATVRRGAQESALPAGESEGVSSSDNISGRRRNPMAESRPNGLAEALERAKEIADRFTKATEAVNERLREVQSALVGLRLGVRGIVELPLPGDEPDWRRYLVFGKVNGDWMLFAESGPEDGRDDWTITSLLNASRELRLAAVDVLPVLVYDMVDSAESAVAESEAKAKALDVFLAATKAPKAARFDGLGAFGIGHPGVVTVTSDLPPDVAKSIELPERPMEKMFGGTNAGPSEPNSLSKALGALKKRRVVP